MKTKRELRRIVITYTVVCTFSFIGYWVRKLLFPEISPADNRTIALFAPVMVATVWESFRAVNRLLNRAVPFEKDTTLRIVVQLLIGLSIMLTVRYLMFDVLRVYAVKSVIVDKGFNAATYLIYLALAFVLNLGFFAAYFFNRWKESIRQAERLEKEKTQVQLDNLKNQLNPHFLFNALTSLNSLIFENQELASQFLQQLSKVYRYLLQHKDKHAVPLKTELEFINHYIFLLKIRFREALEVQVQVGHENLEKGIVPGTLQALFENALKHNIVSEQKPLHISVAVQGDNLQVSNNIQRKTIVENSNKQGLENLKNLYHYLTEQPFGIQDTGERFEVLIPLLEI